MGRLGYRRSYRLTLLIVLCLTLVGCSIIGLPAPVNPDDVDLQGMVIVLDPGHGGSDPGSIATVSGVQEASLNLDMAMDLKGILEARGVDVILTRTDETVVYSSQGDTLKMQDMNHRADVIRDSGADMVISLHMNAFDDARKKGAQVFYQQDDQVGARLAKDIQSAIVEDLQPDNTRRASSEDFFILRNAAVPSVLVECGFITNAEEEEQLLDQQYRQKLGKAILNGICLYRAKYTK